MYQVCGWPHTYNVHEKYRYWSNCAYMQANLGLHHSWDDVASTLSLLSWDYEVWVWILVEADFNSMTSLSPLHLNMISIMLKDIKEQIIISPHAGLGGSVECTCYWWLGGCRFDSCCVWQYSFFEVDHKIFSMVILSLLPIQEGQLLVTGERMCTSTG